LRGASLGLSASSSTLASSLPCGLARRRSRPSATALRLGPSGRSPASTGSFLRGLPRPSGLLRCACRGLSDASHGLSDASRGARYSLYRSVHARLGGLSYRPQNAFSLFIHHVHLPRQQAVDLLLRFGYSPLFPLCQSPQCRPCDER